MVHADEAVRTFANIESVIRGYGGGSVRSRQRHVDRRLPRNVEDSPSTGFQYPKRTISDGSRGILLWSALDTNKLISEAAKKTGSPKMRRGG
jgi:hypothetical protein